MANIFKMSSSVQNIWDGTGTNNKVANRLPAFSAALDGLESVSYELTGTGSWSIANDAGTLSISGDTPKNPFTGAALTAASSGGGSAQWAGFGISVLRAATATAPTGHVRVTLTGICGVTTTSYFQMQEGGQHLFHNPEGPETIDSSSITISLANGTGYKVCFILYYQV